MFPFCVNSCQMSSQLLSTVYRFSNRFFHLRAIKMSVHKCAPIFNYLVVSQINKSAFSSPFLHTYCIYDKSTDNSLCVLGKRELAEECATLTISQIHATTLCYSCSKMEQQMGIVSQYMSLKTILVKLTIFNPHAANISK